MSAENPKSAAGGETSLVLPQKPNIMLAAGADYYSSITIGDLHVDLPPEAELRAGTFVEKKLASLLVKNAPDIVRPGGCGGCGSAPASVALDDTGGAGETSEAGISGESVDSDENDNTGGDS